MAVGGNKCIDVVVEKQVELHACSIKYVVIVGTDEILPFFRVPDELYLANEWEYAERAHLERGALHAALEQGYVLTDDFYVSMNPRPWKGRELYLPDYAIGRLVESPDEVIGMLAKYGLPPDGHMLEVDSALVTGVKFMNDTAEDIVQALRFLRETWEGARAANGPRGTS